MGSRPAQVQITVKQANASVADVGEKPAAPSVKAETATYDDEDYTDDETEALKATREIVLALLERMSVKAQVSTKFAEPVGNSSVSPILVNIEGNDLSFLIGRRSETINALQYITSLMVGKKLNRWTPVQMDVQHYRSRREVELQKLARRMADQVERSGRKQFLEPMPANERRVIHMELRNYPNIETESIGEEPYRKITIKLKR